MKYICLGYYDEKTWETMSERKRNALMDECFAYDDALRKNGHVVGGKALQSARNATTLRWKNGKVFITDGPYAETKEYLGGFWVIEAPDLDAALDANLRTAWNATQAGLAVMRPAAKAELAASGVVDHQRKIVFTSSVAALTGNPGQANYTAAKGAIIALVRTLAQELGHVGQGRRRAVHLAAADSQLHGPADPGHRADCGRIAGTGQGRGRSHDRCRKGIRGH